MLSALVCCLMATVAFSSALSHARVHYLAASAETMLAPGVPSGVAHGIASHVGDPAGMPKAVVASTTDTTFDAGGGNVSGPAAAFVIDLDATKITNVRSAVHDLNADLFVAAKDPPERAAVRADAKSVDGMVRFDEGEKLPWRVDQPDNALYNALSEDARLTPTLRAAALHASNAIGDTVLAHRETDDFAPFGDASYADAYGPTVHFPITPRQVDTWSPNISETDNSFSRSVGAAAVSEVYA